MTEYGKENQSRSQSDDASYRLDLQYRDGKDAARSARKINICIY